MRKRHNMLGPQRPNLTICCIKVELSSIPHTNLQFWTQLHIFLKQISSNLTWSSGTEILKPLRKF